MKEQEHTTLSVDMSVLAAEDQELADCIIAEYDSLVIQFYVSPVTTVYLPS